MSNAISTAEHLPLVIPYRPMRMSVADYHKLISCGTLAEHHRMELLKGVVVEKMTHNPLHAGVILVLQSLLLKLLPSGYLFRCQLPITLRDSEPEPDISIARGALTDFWQRHPGPSQVPLVIEISASSLLTDRFKAEIYAEASIPVYWIVNLVERRVEVDSEPGQVADGHRYASCQHYQPGDSIPVLVDGREVGVIQAAQLLPEISTP